MEENKVLKLAKKGGFDYIDRLDKDWNGYEVYYPTGPNGETLYIGEPLYFLKKGDKVRVATREEAEKICDMIYPGSDYCD